MSGITIDVLSAIAEETGVQFRYFYPCTKKTYDEKKECSDAVMRSSTEAIKMLDSVTSAKKPDDYWYFLEGVTVAMAGLMQCFRLKSRYIYTFHSVCSSMHTQNRFYPNARTQLLCCNSSDAAYLIFLASHGGSTAYCGGNTNPPPAVCFPVSETQSEGRCFVAGESYET